MYAVGFTSIEFNVSSLTGTKYLHILELFNLVRLRTSKDVFLIIPFSLDIVGEFSHTL